MCGIAGFFGTAPRGPETAAAMLAALKNRGPDAQHGVFWDKRFARTSGPAHHALLHARLAIIDPRPEADQPMGNADGSLWLCYNGEVYGWQTDAAAPISAPAPTPNSFCRAMKPGASTACCRNCAA